MRGLLYVASLLAVTAAQSCDQGWAERGNSCYYLSESDEETEMTWYQSRDWCLQNGGELASMADNNEFQFITNKGEESGYKGERWIGLNELGQRDQFTWSDGSSSQFRSWSPGEPQEGRNGKCAVQRGTLQNCYTNEDKINAVKSLLGDVPRTADGENTFTFGYWTNDDVQRCQEACTNEPKCQWFTYIKNSETNFVWRGECLGRSNFQDVRDADEHAVSGQKTNCDGGWRVLNCGDTKGFICKKQKGSDGPRTVPPTDAIPGYCPRDWQALGNKCYKMVDSAGNSGWSWTEARDKCREEPGSDLASIASWRENAAIVTMLPQYSYNFWTGYNKRESSSWRWSDNSDVTFDYLTGFEASVDKCSSMRTYPAPAGIWESNNCDDKYGYICQKMKDGNINTPPVTSPNNCRSDYKANGNACYKFDSTLRSQADAEQYCRNDGGYLASLHTGSENAAVYLIGGGTFPAWIGLKKEDNEYRWSDGWPDRFTQWGEDEPGSAGDCVTMGTDGRWQTADCNSRQATVCRTTSDPVPTTPTIKPGVCPEDWQEFGGHCYYFSNSDNYNTYDNAKHKCADKAGRSYEATLVSIHSQAEFDFVHNGIKDTSGFANAWIGLNKDGFGAAWGWEDGEAVQFTAWAPGEPNDQDGTENCVEMYRSNWPGLWNDIPCSTTLGYVCKADKLPPPTTPTMPPTVEGECPNADWLEYGEYCMLFETANQVSWNMAQEECVRRGNRDAKLATIASGAEDWFIWHRLRTMGTGENQHSAWTGLIKQADKDAVFYWWDGTLALFRNWATGEPNDSDGSENCVELYYATGEWNDQRCTAERGFVCKIRKAGPTTPSRSSASTTTGATAGTTPQQSTGGGLSQTAVAGIVAGVVGILILVGLVVGMTVYFRRQKLPAPSGGGGGEGGIDNYGRFE